MPTGLLADGDTHGVGGLAVNTHDDVNIASASQTVWEFEVELIQADERTGGPGLADFDGDTAKNDVL
jgi:hypothetical protein